MNPNTPQPIEPQPPVIPQSPQTPKKTPIKMPDMGILKEKFNTMYNQLDEKQKKIFKLIAGLVIVIFILAVLSVVVAIIRGVPRSKPAATPIPTIIPSSSPAVIIPSRYASDEAVVKIDQDVKSLDEDLNKSNFRNSELKVPDVYFDKLFQ